MHEEPLVMLKQQLRQVPWIVGPARFVRSAAASASARIRNEAEDARQMFLFRTNMAQRRQWLADYHACKSVQDYYTFAKAAFGLTQIQSEITGFIQLAAKIDPHHICEIGVEKGGTNFLLSQSLPAVKLIVGIDLFVKGRTRLRNFSRPDQELRYINGSSYASRTVGRFRRILGSRTLDVLFIDGDHSYEGVKRDFLSYREFVRNGGLIAFHDICPDYGARFGRDTERWSGGVPAFWNKIKAFYENHEFIGSADQDGLGIGVIRHDPKVQIPHDL